MKKHIGNLGVLDMREATAEIVENIAGIGNVGMLLYTAETKHLLTSLSISNVGSSIETDKDTRIVNGNIELDHETLANTDKPLSYIVNGQISIKRDVTVADVEHGLGKLWVNGVVLCPEACAAVVRSRIETLNGELVADDGKHQIIMGDLNITGSMLQGLAAPTRFLVMGTVTVLDDFDPTLLENIAGLKVYGQVKLRERYASVLGDRLEGAFAEVKIIPDDATQLDDDIELDAAALVRYDKVRLWSDDRIRFTHDVTPEMLRQHIASLRCTDQIVCRKELRPTLLDLSENEPEMLAYTHELLIVDGVQSLSAAELKFRGESFALVVNGKLTIEPDVEPKALFDKLEFVINHGKIDCRGDVCGALRARVQENKGKIVDSAAQEEEKKDEKEYMVKNAGYFKL
ncbi:MAG: hypothetical protein K8R90_11595 [Candidatus Cloacimonetes bacterium]|nr:hypothetical protein [Candidatus Cloacimonadota bacterium]